MPLNTPIYKELMILLMGPLFQFLAYFIILQLFPDNKDIINLYHYSILIFNLLPIYPLDGGKLLNLFFSLKFPLKRSLYMEIFISYLMVLIIILINKENININLIIITIFLLYKITKEYKQVELLYNKFLLERYLYKYNFSKSVIIQNINNFHKNKRHLLKLNDKYYLENEILQKIYKNRWHIKNCYAIILLLTEINWLVMGH